MMLWLYMTEHTVSDAPHSQVSVNVIKNNALFVLQFQYTHAQSKIYHKCIMLPFSIFITLLIL